MYRIGDYMNKRAFTLVELLAVIIVLGILMTMAASAYTGYLNKSRNDSFKLAVNSFRDAVEEAYIDCVGNFSSNSFCVNHKKPTGSNVDRIYLRELVNDNYMEAIKNPYDTNTVCDINNSYVNVKLVSSDNGTSEYSYDVCLKCGNKYSSGCSN